jgi:hypothetical protein
MQCARNKKGHPWPSGKIFFLERFLAQVILFGPFIIHFG